MLKTSRAEHRVQPPPARLAAATASDRPAVWT